jgi:hypothetical protein
LSHETCLVSLLLHTHTHIRRYNEAGIGQDLFPTCQNFVPAVNLDAIDCSDHLNFQGNAPWVYCVDAICTPPADGFANCYCWKQVNSTSIAPGNSTSGATCVSKFLNLGTEPAVVGQEMFDAMNNGELYSTFGAKFGNSSFLPPSAFEACEPNTPFGKCFTQSLLENCSYAFYIDRHYSLFYLKLNLSFSLSMSFLFQSPTIPTVY